MWSVEPPTGGWRSVSFRHCRARFRPPPCIQPCSIFLRTHATSRGGRTRRGGPVYALGRRSCQGVPPPPTSPSGVSTMRGKRGYCKGPKLQLWRMRIAAPQLGFHAVSSVRSGAPSQSIGGDTDRIRGAQDRPRGARGRHSMMDAPPQLSRGGPVRSSHRQGSRYCCLQLCCMKVLSSPGRAVSPETQSANDSCSSWALLPNWRHRTRRQQGPAPINGCRASSGARTFNIDTE